MIVSMPRREVAGGRVARSVSQPIAKGSVVKGSLDFLRQELGEAGCGEILGLLPGRHRRLLLGARPTSEVPYDTLVVLWRAIDVRIGSAAPDWAERAGAYAIAELGLKLYGGILKKRSPEEFLTQSVSLFKLYYHPGNMEVVSHDARSAVLRLVGFPNASQFFCRRQTGGLLTAISLAGGLAPSVRHVRCALEGDAFCEWSLGWKLPRPDPKQPPRGR